MLTICEMRNTREGIPAEEGARKDSRTSGFCQSRARKEAVMLAICEKRNTREGIPAEEGARKDSRTSGFWKKVRERIHAPATMSVCEKGLSH